MDSQASARQACRAGDCRVSLGHDGLQHAKKNSLKPHLGKYWKIPPDESGEFVARMEDVLDVCHRPYSAEFPVACMDESSRQLAGEVTRPMEMSPNHPRLVDDKYARNGVVETFAETGPLTGRQHIKVTDTRTMKDWAGYAREMLDERYPAPRKSGHGWTGQGRGAATPARSTRGEGSPSGWSSWRATWTCRRRPPTAPTHAAGRSRSS